MPRLLFILGLALVGLVAKGQRYAELDDKVIDLFNQEKYEEAIPFALQALEQAKKEFGDTSYTYTTCLSNLGVLYHKINQYSAAEPLFKQAMAIIEAKKGEEHPEYATCANNLAFLYKDLGKYPQTEELFKKTLAIRKRLLGETHPFYLGSLRELATLYNSTNKYMLAEPLYIEILAITKNTKGVVSSDYVVSLSDLAILYQRLGNYFAAEPLYQEALVVLRKSAGDNEINYAILLDNLANLYGSMGKFAEAEPLLLESLTIRKKILGEDHLDYSYSLNSLGVFYMRTGNYSASKPLLQQAVSLRKKLLGAEDPIYINTLGNLAGLYDNMGNNEGAKSLYIEVMNVRRKMLGEEDPDYAMSLHNLAALYEFEGRYSVAEPLWKKALAIAKKTLDEDHPSYLQILNGLGSLYISMSNFSEAELLLQSVLTSRKKLLGEEHPDYITSLSNLAALYLKKKDYVNAEKYCTESSRIMISHTEKNWISFSEEEKLKWWENERGFFQLSPSLLYNHPSVSPGFIKQTFAQQLQLKGFVLNNGVNVLQQVRKSGNVQLQQLVTQWQTNKSILSKQYSLPVSNRMQDLNDLEKSTNDLEKQINQRSAIFRSNQQNQQIDFEKVQQRIKPGEAAIEFVRFNYYNNDWTDSILYAAFVILSGETVPHFVPICEERALSRLLDSKSVSSEQFVKQIYRGGKLGSNKAVDGKKGDSIYSLVWKPLLPWLTGVKKISIAPTGLLYRVAFNALPVDNNTYLIDKYHLRLYSSVRQVAEEKIPVATPIGTIDITLYGGIQFNAEDTLHRSEKEKTGSLPDEIKRSMRGGSWNSLPGTLKEVNSIRQLFSNNKKIPKTITGSAATEESLKKLNGHSPAILHLATHGFSLPNAGEKRKNNSASSENEFTLAANPLLRSGIIMAGANRVWNGAAPIPGKEDGIVTAYEISTLDLSNTELVVLSACETALGDINGTEGVFGLQRAFKLAGVQNMLLSLWQVPDAETAELMNLLYSNKLSGMNTHDAFNRAQETMRKKYPPYYWAAFVLFE